jgi:hypothetical protein
MKKLWIQAQDEFLRAVVKRAGGIEKYPQAYVDELNSRWEAKKASQQQEG